LEIDETNPRRLAVTILDRVLRDDAFADTVLDSALKKNALSRVDGALATELVYGTLRWLSRIDWAFQALYLGKLRGIPGRIRRIAEVGLYQVLFLDKIPSYAAVNEAVEAAKESGGPHWAGIINAVLRNAIRHPDKVAPSRFDFDPVCDLSIRSSHPVWLVRKWVERFGLQRAASICAANNEVPFPDLRVNLLKTDRATLKLKLQEEGIRTVDSKWHDDFLVAEEPGKVAFTDSFARGWFTVQDESAGFVARLLNLKKGEILLDLSAAPGGKATAAAESTGDGALIIAVDLHLHRIRRITENRKRLGIRRIHPVAADGTLPIVRAADKVLVDAPCSGMGILRKRPEIKWKRGLESLPGLVSLQAGLLDSAAEALKPGGLLVYSTCTLLDDENGGMVSGFLRKHPEFSLERASRADFGDAVSTEGWIETWPDLHGMDGSFAAIMKKAG
jgi:16S rRNA (cytosine967-C5)-methyltransferase